MDLLSKIRRINRLLQKTAGHPVNFIEMAEVLSVLINANTFVLSRRGKILGHAIAQQVDSERIVAILNERKFPIEYNNKLLRVEQTTANIDIKSPYTAFPVEMEEIFQKSLTTIVPVIGGGDRLGTLILAKVADSFIDDDLILAEVGATVVGMEILRERTEEIEQELRSKAVVQMAVGSLSYSELEAVDHIFQELDGKEGLLIASKIADRVGITRSVIVNALRKLESAGVIESRSLGMKGTFIKVLNDKLVPEVEKLKSS